MKVYCVTLLKKLLRAQTTSKEGKMSKSDDAKLCRKGGRKEVVELQRRRNENAKYLCTHVFVHWPSEEVLSSRAIQSWKFSFLRVSRFTMLLAA